MKPQDLDATLKPDFMMRGRALAQLPVFAAVAARGGFTAGARELAISPSAASQAIARLEQELGTPLLVRTTRSVRTTDAGARLLAQITPALAALVGGLRAVTRQRDDPSGVLRLSAPRVACRLGLPAVLAAYARRCPAVRVEIVIDDRRVDLVRDHFDAGIRSQHTIDKDMVRVRITPPVRFVVVGSRRYFAAHGRPRHPRDLVDHRCLAWRSLNRGGEYRWEFSQRGRDLEVAVGGPLVCNDTELLVACAARGLGLAFVAEADARRELAAGRLETALDDYTTRSPGLFLYFPRAARTIPKIRALADCARELAAP